MSDPKPTDEDQLDCDLIAKSISEIIRFSLDEDFRRSCFELFAASSTKETEKEITRRLKLILESKGKPETFKKRNRNALDTENEKERQEKEQNTPGEKPTDESPATAVDSQSLSEKIFSKSWLQISSQHYREVVKKRKLNCFSQPQFGLSFPSESASSRSSRPVPSTSATHSEPLGNEINFCHEKFKNCFKDNVKYLKKNLKSKVF